MQASTTSLRDMTDLTLALSKGRILEEALPLLQRIGLAPAGDIDRKLRVPAQDPRVSLLIIRPSDVPTYVEYGAADFGIVGKDVLMEHGSESLYEPVDLGIARCRMSVAAPKDAPQGNPCRRLRVATKYPQIARAHYAAKGEQVEIIKLYGSMELAPLVGLSDVIVDLVASGGTLRANGLVEREVICDISSRLVVNKAALKMKNTAIHEVIAQFRAAVSALELAA
jgi:ATP phosphoribosyltransferase